MKIMLPKEHGAWAMWIAPFILGITVSEIKWMHFLLLVSVFFAYISISPFLQGIRRKVDRKEMWTHSIIYLTIAFIFSMPLLFSYLEIIYILVIIAPLFLVNIYYVKQKNERALLNDLSAMISLNSVFLVSFYVGSGSLNAKAFITLGFIILFFFGSALYVKTIYREKNNKSFKLIAKIYSILLPIVGLIVSGFNLFLAFVISPLRVFLSKSTFTPKQVGIIEIINTLWFVVFVTVSFRIWF